jgi:hypothetical protein
VNRAPLAAAIGFAVLFVATMVIAPLTPGIDRSGEELVDHFQAHAGMIRLQALLTALAMLALLVVLGYTRDRLEDPGRFLFTVGAAVLVVETSIQLWFTAGLSLHPGQLDPATARTVMDVAAMWGPLLTVADVLVAAPVAWAAKFGRFPRGLGVIAALFAVEQLVELVTVVGPAGTFVAPAGPMNMFLGAGLFGVFYVALGIAVALPQRAAASDRHA